MDTHEKGEEFENRFFKAIKKELELNRLGVNAPSCKLFQHKGYYSRDRDKEIIFDVSIEMFIPGADEWSLLWVWECKDYKSSINVDDIEEFWAKLQQIGGVNIKGGVATTSAIQISAMKFADSKGISVVRLLPEDHINWVLYATGYRYTTKKEYYEAFTIPEFIGETCDFYGMSCGLLFQDFSSMLKSTWVSIQQNKSYNFKDDPFLGHSVEKLGNVFDDK